MAHLQHKQLCGEKHHWSTTDSIMSLVLSLVPIVLPAICSGPEWRSPQKHKWCQLGSSDWKIWCHIGWTPLHHIAMLATLPCKVKPIRNFHYSKVPHNMKAFVGTFVIPNILIWFVICMLEKFHIIITLWRRVIWYVGNISEKYTAAIFRTESMPTSQPAHQILSLASAYSQCHCCEDVMSKIVRVASTGRHTCMIWFHIFMARQNGFPASEYCHVHISDDGKSVPSRNVWPPERSSLQYRLRKCICNYAVLVLISSDQCVMYIACQVTLE